MRVFIVVLITVGLMMGCAIVKEVPGGVVLGTLKTPIIDAETLKLTAPEKEEKK